MLWFFSASFIAINVEIFLFLLFQTLSYSYEEVKPYVLYSASGFADTSDSVKSLRRCSMFSMGKEQELLDAARSGNVVVTEKILSQKNKWNLPLLPQQLTTK